MIGIDIIDLSDPLIKSRGKRSLQLILHKSDWYPKDTNSFWLLWAAKEAVFKCYRKTERFSPTDIPIKISYLSTQSFRFSSGNITGRLYQTRHYVLAYCGSNGLPEYSLYFSSFKADSSFIRKKIKLQFPEFEIVHDKNKLPLLSSLNIPLSISHHGQYAAFAIDVTNIS